MKQILNDSNTKFVDVRSATEYSTGHVKGAVNIPLDELPGRVSEIKELGKTPVVFYCRSGNRSGQAVGFLSQHGYGNIYNGGGIDDLLQSLN